MPAGPTPGGGLGRNAYARDRPVIASRHAVVGPAAARGLGRRISYGIVETRGCCWERRALATRASGSGLRPVSRESDDPLDGIAARCVECLCLEWGSIVSVV